MSPLAAADLLREARRLLEVPSGATASAWPRASAFLTRQALETALDGYWRIRAPGMEAVPSMRAKLSCLRFYLEDGELVSDVAFTWFALSHATHHRPYELDPTRDELASLVATTERAVVALAART